MIIDRDKLFNVVGNLRTPGANGQEQVGTATFVVRDSRLFLLTASHVASETTPDTVIVVSDRAGNATKFSLSEITLGRNWRHHPEADLAHVRLNVPTGHEGLFESRFFPIEQIDLSQGPVSRDVELTVIGFPLGLGAESKFSPLTFRTFAASSPISLLRADTKTPCTFFVLESPGVGGFSGGPVFDLGYTISGSMVSTRERTTCHGFIHGTLSDVTGGKLAVVTPGSYLTGWL